MTDELVRSVLPKKERESDGEGGMALMSEFRSLLAVRRAYWSNGLEHQYIECARNPNVVVRDI
jgi:hypothetical protein